MTDAVHGAVTGAGASALASTLPPPAFGPRGLGLYARSFLLDPHALVDQLHEIAADHVAIQLAHVKHGAAKALADAGIPWRLFSTPAGDGDSRTPDSWLPGEYGATLREFERIVLGEGGAGILADTENEWPRASRAMRAKLGRDLLVSAQRLREHGRDVGMTTFLSHPLRHELGSICGAEVYCSTQLYESRPAALNAHVLAEEKAFGWAVSVPSLGAYVHFDTTPHEPGGWSARPRTADEWRSAYGDFPEVQGALVWPVMRIRGALAAAIAAMPFAA